MKLQVIKQLRYMKHNFLLPVDQMLTSFSFQTVNLCLGPSGLWSELCVFQTVHLIHKFSTSTVHTKVYNNLHTQIYKHKYIYFKLTRSEISLYLFITRFCVTEINHNTLQLQPRRVLYCACTVPETVKQLNLNMNVKSKTGLSNLVNQINYKH